MTDGQAASGRPAAVIAIVAIGYFAVAAVATHLVSPQYDFVRDYISDYAVGPTGWIYGSAFIASAIGTLALALALWWGLPRAALSRTGAILLVLVGVTYFVDFLFPTDILAPGEPPRTMVGQIHLADAFLGWVLFVVAAFLILHRLRRDVLSDRWRGTLLALTWLVLVVLVALVGVVVAKLPVGGLVEKTFILVRNIWALLLAILLLQRRAAAAPAASAAPLA